MFRLFLHQKYFSIRISFSNMGLYYLNYTVIQLFPEFDMQHGALVT